MTRRTFLVLGAVALIAAIAIVLAPPAAQPSVIRGAILAFGVTAAWLLIRRTSEVTRATPEGFEQELRRPVEATADVPSLRSIDTTLRMASASAFGVEIMLKPLLRELLEWRLAREHNIDLATAPDAARERMGDALWRLIHVEDPNRDHGARGMRLAEVEACIDRLEQL